MSDIWTTRFRDGGYYRPVTVTKVKDRLELQFPFSRSILADVKGSMDRPRWHGYDESPRKVWSVKDSQRTRFVMAYLAGEDPYVPYDAELTLVEPRRKLYTHQTDMYRHAVTRRQCILAGQVGVGKTLAAIESLEWAAENLGLARSDFLWVGPKSALHAVQLEFEKWNSRVRPEMVTFEGLVKLMENWPAGKPAPRFFVGDEAHKFKTWTSKRTQAAAHLANNMREEWGRGAFILLMTGTPAPKDPSDWWSLCEVACPGFLREGNVQKFKERLAWIEERESLGQKYPFLVGWKNDSRKCAKCGRLPEEGDHDVLSGGHAHTPSANEVQALHDRLKGLVMVRLKKDCLELPELRNVLVRCEPSTDTLRVAKALVKTAPSAAQALILTRELSDGFLYKDRQEKKPCPDCGKAAPCLSCRGTGYLVAEVRETVRTTTPKDAALCDLMEEYWDVGRLVVYAAFQASVDRVEELFRKAQWEVVVADGRGWRSSLPGTETDWLLRFQSDEDIRIAFLGHAASAGTGMTLTASPAIVFYSNSDNGDDRMQAKGRIHRPGASEERGCTIYDLVHLPSDELIVKRLDLKENLQGLTLGEIQACYGVAA